MEVIISLVNEFGLPLAIVIAGGMAAWRYLPGFLQRKDSLVEDAQEQSNQAVEDNRKRIDMLDKMLEEEREECKEALAVLSARVDALENENKEIHAENVALRLLLQTNGIDWRQIVEETIRG